MLTLIISVCRIYTCITCLAGEGGDDVAGGVGDDGDVCGGEAVSIEADVLIGLQCALECCFACNGCEGHGLGFFYVMQYFDE